MAGKKVVWREFGDEPLEGSFDARMLGQAVGNLIKNAVESIEAVPREELGDGGKVLVRSAFDHEQDRFVVDVIDNGRGLPVENRRSLGLFALAAGVALIWLASRVAG